MSWTTMAMTSRTRSVKDWEDAVEASLKRVQARRQQPVRHVWNMVATLLWCLAVPVMFVALVLLLGKL